MSKVVIIGAGGVGNVVAQKCAQLADVFTEIVLASRTVTKCEAIAADVKVKQNITIRTAALNADDVAATTNFLQAEQPEILINVALPYQDLALMDACLTAGVHYIDTANYEPHEEAKFEYKWQWEDGQKGSGQWKNYIPKDDSTIEALFKKKGKQCTLKNSWGTYIIDLTYTSGGQVTGTQKKQASGWVRPIRRVRSSQSSSVEFENITLSITFSCFNYVTRIRRTITHSYR